MRVLFCCVILFPCLLYSAGYVNYEQLTNKGNIINQSVFNIVKDRKGFVWIASKTGISRYDGFNYKKYALSLMGEIPNENSRQTGIYTGDDNRLWAYNDRGNIYFYDPYSDTFIFYVSIREISDNAFWLSDIYWHNNRLWMATSNSLLSFGIVEREKKTKKYFDGLAVNKIIAINDSVLAAGTTAGLVFVNTSRETGGEEIVCKDHHITSLFYDNLNHQLWIGTFNSGLFIWDTQKKTFLPDNFTKQISLNPIRVVKQLDNDNLLIGSDGSGIYKIDRTKKTIELFLSDKYNGNRQLAGNGVYDILIDDKSIWVGIYYGGLTILRGYDDLDRIYHIPHDKESLIDGYVNAILEDSNGNMWYACNSGISMQEVKTKKWTHFFEKQNSFLSLMEDNRGQIWCGGYNTGVYCIDKNKKIIRHIKSFQNKEEMDCIYASAIDKDGDLWFGGLYNPLTRISHENGQEKFTFYDIMQVRNIVPLNRDTLFVATSIGYCLLNKQTGKFDRHVGAVIKNDPYSNSYVYSGILLDNNLWFGTDGGGLNCFNLTTRNISNYSDISGGLPSNCIYGILTDRENTFWISADNGLFNFDPQTQKVLSSIADLPEKGFVPMSYTQLKDGRMAFGSRNGAIIFNPEKIKHNQKKSNFHFTDFRISYKSVTSKDDPRVLPVPVDEISHITLSHNQNTFAFDFISIDLYDPNNYLYDYKLEGFNQEWIPQSNTQPASYTNIPPGKYRFIVRCFSSAGKEILDERIISITILPPFYNTVWAWLVYFLLLCGIIYWIYIYFKERLQQRQSNEKINFFINVAHDIRTPLSLVMAPLKDMEKESGLSESAQNSLHLANKNGTKLLSIVNQLLDFQKEAILPSLLDLTVCDFKAYLTERVESFKPYADTKNIHIHTDIPVESIVLEIDVNKMDRILDNLLSNAVKYTQNGGDIFIRLSKKKNRMELVVRDTGIGISKKEARKIFHHFFRAENAVNSKETGSGIGLVLTKKLVKQMNGKLS
ncbi:MAG: hypothetical protein LBH19_14095, partial [Dysgonamonadaceae bacterium]|nr:hypothetical protein [Dysgonamonadaceae bacterium]